MRPRLIAVDNVAHGFEVEHDVAASMRPRLIAVDNLIASGSYVSPPTVLQ